MSERAGVVATAALLLCCAAVFPVSVGAEGGKTPTEELQIFKAWLDRVRPGYGCDEGPARFRNEKGRGCGREAPAAVRCAP